MLQDYLDIAKPGIIRGNLIIAIAAFMFASIEGIDFIRLVITSVGIGLIIASAAIANNCIDKKIDSKMSRTKNRPLANNKINLKSALVYSVILGMIGLMILFIFINVLTAVIGLISYIFYVFIYAYFKRHSIYSTLVGSLPGATPPLAGYVAVTNHVDYLALALFFILLFWQVPHFYAIALFRKEDYSNAGLPVASVVKGSHFIKVQSLVFICLFVFINALLFGFNKTGYAFFGGVVFVSIWWLKIAIDGLQINVQMQEEKWAKKMFKTSLVVLGVFSMLLALNNYLP